MPRRSSPDLFSISAASEILNRSRRTVTKALRGIRPAVIESGLAKWPMGVIVRAINENTMAPIAPHENHKNGKSGPVSSLAADRSRLLAAQTQAIEMKNAITAGEYVRADVVAGVFEGVCSVMRDRILLIPGACADQICAVQHSRAEIETILRRCCYAALEELADPRNYPAPGTPMPRSSSDDSEPE